MSERVTEVMLLPEGGEADYDNARSFAVVVRWRGPRGDTGRGGYAITSHGDQHLSHRGKWRYSPEPFLQRHYRWEHLDSALVTARGVVDAIRVNGKTWAEWQEHFGK